MNIKSFVKREVFVYKSWLFFKQSVQKQLLKLFLPEKGHDFYIDGYPRSGNTFCISFVNWLMPDKKYAHHLHCIAPIKIALGKKLPVVILYRNPKDAVSSFAIMQDFYGKGMKNNSGFLTDLLNEYIEYYEFVLDNKDQIRILGFDTIINVPKLNEFFNKENKIRTVTEQDLVAFEENFKKRQQNKPKERSSTPNDVREQLKKDVDASIQNLPNYNKAVELFNQMNKLRN